MDEEYINVITDKFIRMNCYERKNLKALQRNKTEIQDLVNFINSILSKYISETIDKQHVRFNADYIGNISAIQDKKLSNLIFDKYFPNPTCQSYYHYTSLNAYKSILESKKLRLYNLNKRFSHGEFTTFYEEHGMTGLKDGSFVLGIDCSEEAVMSEIFYMSFSGSGFNDGDNSLWKDFGDHGNGVRLEFKVTPHTKEFRKVFYSNDKNENSIPLLKEIFTKILEKYNMPFNFTYSSKIGAFYIKGKYLTENEFRFIIKRTSDDYNAAKIKHFTDNEDMGIKYIEIDFINEYCDFEILSIQPGYNCLDDDISEIEKIAKLTGLEMKILPKAREEYY